jgi:hypothetical protein
MSTDAVPPPAPLWEHPVGRAILPLRLIFWGGLLMIFDLKVSQKVNGEGFQFDVLNDALGAALIAWGVFRLATIPVPGRYAAAMTLVKVTVILAFANAVRAHVIMPLPDAMSVALFVLGLAKLAAIVVFCWAMRRMCLHYDLARAAASWRVTLILFAAIYLVPLGAFYLLAAGTIATGASFHFDLGLLGLLVLPVFALPLVHLFVSTSRMKRDVAAAVLPAELPPGSPAAAGVGAALAIGLIVGLVGGVAVPAAAKALWEAPDAITSLWESEAENPSIGRIQISSGENEQRRMRVLVVNHNPVPEVLKNGVAYSSDRPVAGLKTRVAVKSAFPADREQSGLWIDGRHVPLKKPLTFIYNSPQHAAMEIDVPADRTEEIAKDVRAMGAGDFLAKWVPPPITMGG